MRADPMSEADGMRKPTNDFDVAAALRDIAQPRLTGSDGAAEVTAAVRDRLASLGYDVEERTFSFSPWPGRFGLTAAGAVYLLAMVAAAALLGAGHAYAAMGVLVALLAVLAALAGVAARAIDHLTFRQAQGVNLFAQRPGSRPRYVIMAHRDSKSQLVPLAFRGPAIVVAVLVWVALLITAVVATVELVPGTLVLVLGVLAAAAGLVLVLCWADNRSPGALDNASGVVAALGIAAREGGAGDVAFLITDAEELGLAGARAAAPHLPPVMGVINLDGLDDDGTFYVLERFGTFRKQGLAPHLAVALLQEADALGEAARRRDLPFGVPVDHIPIVRAGTPALTVMRGSTRSLRRVHQPGDDLDHLRGDGVRRAIDLVCGALVRLREQTRALER
jgi:hypothetical protein